MDSKFSWFLLATCAVSAPAVQAATPFDTRGPFVYYNAGAGQTYVPGTSPVHVVSDTAIVDGQGGFGLSKAAVQRLSGNGVYAMWSGWNDSLTFNAGAGLAGTQGTVRFRMNYSWSAQVAGTSSGSAYADVNLLRIGAGTGPSSQYAEVEETITRSCSVAGQCGSIAAYATASTPVPTFANGVATFTFNVVFGQAYTIIAGMNIEVTDGQGAILIDSSHSLYWGGIAAVTAGGAAVNYQLTSGSGVDYTQPVPEAPIWAMLGLGSLLTGLKLRRSRHG